MSEWQPIETAPKDGTRILVWDADGGVPVLVCWLDDSTDRRQRTLMAWCVPESWQDEQGGYATVDRPTHWMLLPKPPVST